MATPAVYNLNLRIGDTEQLFIAVQDSTTTPISVAGRTYTAQIRPTAASSTVLASFTCTVDGDGTAGTITCTLPASTTSTLTAGQAVWDLQETSGTTVTTILAGSCTITQDITR